MLAKIKNWFVAAPADDVLAPVEPGGHEIELLPPELLRQIQGIQMRVRHLVSETLAGDYTSAFKGRGVEFEEVREYQPGDDVRTIDWNVTARMGHPFVKEYREERELTVLLVVDVSGSSLFGTTGKFKSEVAAEVAAILAYTAIHSNDKVGLLVFSDRVEHYIPPKKGRAHVWRVIRTILKTRAEHRRTDLSVALDFLGNVMHRRAVMFLVSDFMGEGFEQALRRLSQRHELVAVSITDPCEVSMPAVGFLELEDAETGEAIVVDSSSAEFRQAFEKTARKGRQALARTMASANIDLITITTDEPYIDPIVRFFHRTRTTTRRRPYGPSLAANGSAAHTHER
jgi:uncharacterized protein (DUF58 family)